MLTFLRQYSRRLPIRLVLSFTLVVALSALLVGIPALLLIQGELAEQIERQLHQGASTTHRLYQAQQSELLSLATLTAQRPTLHRLLQEERPAVLLPYLETIQRASEVDLLLVTDLAGDIVAAAPTPLLPPFGALETRTAPVPGTTLEALNGEQGPIAMLVGRAPILTDSGVPLGTVIGGISLDAAFLRGLGEETGLGHSIFADGERVDSALPALPESLDIDPDEPTWLAGEPFYLFPLTLEASNAEVVDLIALPAADLVTTRVRVVQILGASTLLVTGLAALLAYLLARHITSPLQHLVAASEAVGRGDLATPIANDQMLVEVAALANTLEQMRHRLHTAYEELQRAKQWYEELIGSLAEGVVTVDEAWRITSFSPGAERILGWEASEVIGRPYESLLPLPTDHDPPMPLRRDVATKQGGTVTLRVTRGARALHVGEGWEQAFVFRDVTEQERALALREFLLANVSHEFKTPLAAVRAAVELLTSDLPALSQSELREMIGSVWQGTVRLEELVDNLLSSASLRAGHFALRPRTSDLEVMIEEALLASRPLLALKGQHLHVEAPSPLPPVWADPRRIHQVLINLISNASKYGPTGEGIRLEVELHEAAACIRIRDRGPGIAPEVQPQLFKPFARPQTVEQSGIGLGLSIVREIVARHGGAVGMESELGAGATSWFTLPFAPRETSPERKKDEDSGSG